MNRTAVTSHPAMAVLIVGAGPTGLTLACDLARKGVPFRLIDAAPGPQPGSRGKGVQPRSMEVFADLGVADRVMRHGRFAMPIRSTAPDGTVTMGGGEPGELRDRPDIPYATSLVTPQWRVEEALRLRLEELGGTVEFGTVLVDFAQSAESVTVTVGVDGRTESFTVGWVVGCDGGHSVVRRITATTFAGDTREDVRMIVADVAVTGVDRDSWHVWRHDDGMVMLCPLPSTDLFQYQASIARGQDAEAELENLQRIVERRSGRRDIVLDSLEWSSLWRANVRLADRYRIGRVFLAGDAAHVHSPAGGQGMNTGIQDAYNLGWKLTSVIAGAPDALLDSYEAERRPVAAAVLAMSDARLAQATRDRGISTQRDAGTTQLGVGYRGSDLAHDDRDEQAELRAGDRAPDATGLMTVDGERRLFDLTQGGRFTVLSFGAVPVVETGRDPFRALRVVEWPSGPDEVADVQGHLAGAYAATDRTVVLIRPDGYIASISGTGSIIAAAGLFGIAPQ